MCNTPGTEPPPEPRAARDPASDPIAHRAAEARRARLQRLRTVLGVAAAIAGGLAGLLLRRALRRFRA